MAAQPVLEVAIKPARQKSRQELEIERLASLSAADLTTEDLAMLRRIRDCRASVLAVEAELEEVKERKKARVATFDQAVLDATMYFENRQLALKFGE